MNSPNQYPDQRIDHILHALAITEAPTGLEQRISARIAQRAASAPTRTPIFSLRRLVPAPIAAGGMYPWAIVAALLLVSVGWFLITHPKPQQMALQPSRTLPASRTASQITPAASILAKTIPTQQQSLYHFVEQLSTTTPQDPSDAVALAETLAPSHPAPPLPLTPQEALLLRSTRPGQPIEVAELDTLRESALSTRAFTREQSRIRQYAEGLLGPLATAQLLTPSSSLPPDEPTFVPNPEPPPSR